VEILLAAAATLKPEGPLAASADLAANAAVEATSPTAEQASEQIGPGVESDGQAAGTAREAGYAQLVPAEAPPNPMPNPTIPLPQSVPASSSLAAGSTRPDSTNSTVLAQAQAPAKPGFDWHDLVEPDLWELVPKDLPELLALLPNADLYVQDEVEVRFHPTLTRVWSPKGHRGQRLVWAPGQNRRFVGFLAADWRDGWLSIGYGLHRSADLYCQQLDHLVERSQRRGHQAIVLTDNLGIHTPKGSKLLREALERHQGKLRLVYTPPYDPEANPTERLFPRFRLAVTHNHHRDNVVTLYEDTLAYFDRLDHQPKRVLGYIASPFANSRPTRRSRPEPTLTLAGSS
jgi:hypothetical protein